MSDLYKNFRKSLGGYPDMIQIKEPKNKQKTNKQRNKQIFRSTISQLNQVKSLRNLQKIFLAVSTDDSNEKNKTNKQIKYKHYCISTYLK